MELRVTIRPSEDDAPKYLRKRMSDLLGGLGGLNSIASETYDPYAEAMYVQHRLCGGEFLDLVFLDRALAVLGSMKDGALKRSTPDWWRENECPDGDEINLAATYLQ